MDTPADMLRLGGARELLEDNAGAQTEAGARSGIVSDWTLRLGAVLADRPELARPTVVVHGGYTSDSEESAADEPERAHGGGRHKKAIPTNADSLLSEVVAVAPEARRHHLHSWHGPLSAHTENNNVDLFSQGFDDMGFQVASSYNPFSNYVQAFGGSAHPNLLDDLDSDCGCDGPTDKGSDEDSSDEDSSDEDSSDEDSSDEDDEDEAEEDEAEEDEAEEDEADEDKADEDEADDATAGSTVGASGLAGLIVAK
jgi:cobalamin biosynthesis protein CobT